MEIGGSRRDSGVGWERERFRRRREVARRRGRDGCVVLGVREQIGGRAEEVGAVVR